MNRALLLAPLFLLLSCSDRDYCAEAPRCDEAYAINCEPSCTVGPCSTGPHLLECEAGERCTVVVGDSSSPRFFRSRALCVEEGSASCDPATAPAPVCEEQGVITGCSGYKRVIRTSCSQAALYFTESKCCRETPQVDGGPIDSTDGGR
ncbi:hypothetical protein [Hyalangium sp.]|uniref:hypothetical protein n=1 Tax=Hyalangium sp. TaxID=2028555 RepID=UPI002D70AA4B|nr:hypothetical protein [Hyalangium sp.]HYH98043.1 hypothetical protein [Hyalangium sp.]